MPHKPILHSVLWIYVNISMCEHRMRKKYMQYLPGASSGERVKGMGNGT